MMKEAKIHIPPKTKGKNTPMETPNNSGKGDTPPAMKVKENGIKDVGCISSLTIEAQRSGP